MKLSTLAATSVSGPPVLAWLALASADATAAEIVQGLSTIGAAGLVWWLLAVRDPKREADAARLQRDHEARIDRLYKNYEQRLTALIHELRQPNGESSNHSSNDGESVSDNAV